MAIFSHGMFFWRTLKRCFLFWLGIAWRCLRISDEVWVWDDWKWRNYCPMCNPFLKEKHWVLDNEIWGDPILKKTKSNFRHLRSSECVGILWVRVIMLCLLLSYSLKLKFVALHMCQCEYSRIDASALIYDVYYTYKYT